MENVGDKNMNMKNIVIITLFAVFLIMISAVSYSLILNIPGQNNNVMSIGASDNAGNNSTNVSHMNSEPINNNNQNKNNTNTNNHVATSDNKEQSPYNTPDGKPRTSHPQSGYNDGRRSMNAYSDYVDSEGKYDPWTMGKYETSDGNVLYFNKK